MAKTNRARLEARLAQLEELWGAWDRLCASLSAADWARPHGDDWTLADAPYHLYFFDQELIAEAIGRGPDVGAEPIAFRTMGEMSVWNQGWFAKRPVDQTSAHSLAQALAAREAIRRAVAPLTDADLDRPVWLALVSTRGWRTVDFALWVCLIHTWIEWMELQHYAGRQEPALSPALTHVCLDGYLQLLQIFFQPAQAAQVAMTVAREITGSGGGVWTIQIADGACTIRAGRPTQHDLVITQSQEQCVDALLPLAIRKRGLGQASDEAQLARFSHCFPPPAPDQVLPPLP